jgi:hypothetical protein
VKFTQKRLLIWLYKSFDGSSLTCGKTYGAIRQYPMTIRIKARKTFVQSTIRVQTKVKNDKWIKETSLLGVTTKECHIHPLGEMCPMSKKIDRYSEAHDLFLLCIGAEITSMVGMQQTFKRDKLFSIHMRSWRSSSKE